MEKESSVEANSTGDLGSRRAVAPSDDDDDDDESGKVQSSDTSERQHEIYN
jgi:hypothetical protein